MTEESKRVRTEPEAGEEEEERLDDEGDVAEEDEEELKVIMEEHKIWKKNAPFLYDVCMKYNTKSAPLTCQWLPPKTEVEPEYSSHELLLGLKRTDECTTALNVMRVLLPNAGIELEVKEFNEKSQELGGYANNISKLNPIMEIIHDDDVNRARFMPSDHFVVATRMGLNVAVFKLDSIPGKPKDSQCRPTARGIGHTEEGYGLDWSLKTPGHLLTCGSDGIYLWNVDRLSGSGGGEIQLVRSFDTPAADCAWNPHKAEVFATVSLEGKIESTFWDVRESKSVFSVNTGTGELNAIAFNPSNENIFVTGGASKVVQVWDIRKIEKGRPQHEMHGHNGEIYALQWAPFKESILASCGEDRRVNIWDLDQIGKEQTPEEAEDGDPELLFVHAGHCSRVTDLSWNPNDEWVIASVADNGADGDVQVWQVADTVYLDDDDEDDGDNDE